MKKLTSAGMKLFVEVVVIIWTFARQSFFGLEQICQESGVGSREHLAQLHVQTFDRTGGVNYLSDFIGITEKGRGESLDPRLFAPDS
jgi:hypothetical protein